jgi:hypothetical protein
MAEAAKTSEVSEQPGEKRNIQIHEEVPAEEWDGQENGKAGGSF